jgi:hypothetical protein
MNEKNDSRCDYIRDVTERTRAYLMELQQENARLRGQLAVSQIERRRIAGELAEALRRLEAQAREPSGLDAEQLERLETEKHQYTERFVVLEQKNARLASLYVASYRLHETLSRQEVVGVIHEIVVNLIGCEQHAVFERSADGGALKLLGGIGLGEASVQQVPLNTADEVGRAVDTGEVYIARGAPTPAQGHPYPITACVPLMLDKRCTGAIVLYHLLPQKSGIEDIDRELFELLAVHAGVALYCTKLHQSLSLR